MHSAGNTFMNAVVGALVALVLVVLPFSPAVGGAVAGYLQRGSTRSGAKAGVVVGLLVAFPLALAVVALAPVLLFAPAGVPSIPLNAGIFVVAAMVVTGAYAIGSAVVGGAVGTYLAAARADADAVATADTTATDPTRDGPAGSTVGED